MPYDDRNTLAKAYVDHSTTFLALAAITFDVSVIEEMMPLYQASPLAVIIAIAFVLVFPGLFLLIVEFTVFLHAQLRVRGRVDRDAVDHGGVGLEGAGAVVVRVVRGEADDVVSFVQVELVGYDDILKRRR